MPPYAAGGQDAVLEVRDQAERDHAHHAFRASISSSALEDRLLHARTAQRACAQASSRDCTSGPDAMSSSVMAERGDIPLLSRVWASYGEQLERKLNVNVVDVTTVVPLDDHLREVITEQSRSRLGHRRSCCASSIDKSLLGGILMSVDGKRIDASIDFAARNTPATVLKQSTDGGEC